MDQKVQITNGEEKIWVEMTVKEALALSGSKFTQNHQLETDAIKKVRQTLEQKFFQQ